MEVSWGHDFRVVLCNNYFHFSSLKYPKYAAETSIGLMTDERTRSLLLHCSDYILLHSTK